MVRVSKSDKKARKKKVHSKTKNLKKEKQAVAKASPTPKARRCTIQGSNATLDALKATTKAALVALTPQSIDLPGAFTAEVRQLKPAIFRELIERGKCHLAYALVVILRDRLPAPILSRGSLTLIREAILCRKGLNVIQRKLRTIHGVRWKPIKTFYASLACIADRASVLGVQNFLSQALDRVFLALCEKALHVKALHKTGVVLSDNTTHILKNIKENRESKKRVFSLKRPYSPVRFLMVPTEIEPALKAQLPGQNRNIQNVILAACAKAAFPAFSPLPSPAWAIVLGDVKARDPLETCGDAALQVLITELLMEKLKDDKQGQRIRKAITLPLLSNVTFLHILLGNKLVTLESRLPIPNYKYAGNAFEVFAGALAILVSWDVFRDWAKAMFQPIVEETITAWREHKIAHVTPRLKRNATNVDVEEGERPAKRRRSERLRNQVKSAARRRLKSRDSLSAIRGNGGL
ncbi:hypothetical protein B0H19DRAFT_571042 [Mycena capillaripes]|nr:hypothetical protein B0H19DRAFT_571042 [Mycena capillaripes]